MSAARYAAHLGVLLACLLLVQAPRLGGLAAQLASPIFPRHRGYPDFNRGYYPAGRSIREDPSQLLGLYQGEMPDGGEGHRRADLPYFVNLPLVAWLFGPLSMLPQRRAGAVFLWINLALALACQFLLLRRAAAAPRLLQWGITLAFATSGPLIHALNYGQTTPLTLLLLLLAESQLRRGRDRRAGLLLGLTGLVKIPPLLFLIYLVLRQRWRIVASAVGVLLAGAALSIALYGWPLHAAYIDLVFRPHLAGTIASPVNQSMSGVLARLLTPASLLSWAPFRPESGVRFFQVLAAAALIGLCGWGLSAQPRIESYRQTLLELSAVMCVSLLISPFAWIHYGIWLLPVIVVLGAETLGSAGANRGGSILIAAAVLINLPVLPRAVVVRFGDDFWFRAAVSHEAIGTLLLFGLCLYCLRASPRHATAARTPAANLARGPA